MSHPSNIVPALEAINHMIDKLENIRSRIRCDSDAESCHAFVNAVISGSTEFFRAHLPESREAEASKLHGNLCNVLMPTSLGIELEEDFSETSGVAYSEKRAGGRSA